jgi:tRNA pseudouridine38-40 synthase
MRIKLVVSYDGTKFCGWAAQPGLRTVQGTLKEAVRQISGEDCEITGASRTDSGAHAKGQVCHFDSPVPIPSERWARVLNKILPDDLAIVRSTLVSAGFHARFSAEDRTYRYRISTAPRDPLLSRYVCDFGRPLDVDLMRLGAEHLVGTHDYVAFTEELDSGVLNTTRTLHRISIVHKPKEVAIEITGTAFLRGMMRRISGGLLEVGRGYRPMEEISMLLTERRSSLQLPVVLPAKGLCLHRIRYANPPRDHRESASRLAE